MKLIIAGASGFIATELIRQSLSIPQITSLIALSRVPVPVPPNVMSGADITKLHSVVLENYDSYPDDVKTQLAGADACIWFVPELSLTTNSLLRDCREPVEPLEDQLGSMMYLSNCAHDPRPGLSQLFPQRLGDLTLTKYAEYATTLRSADSKPCSPHTTRAARAPPNLFASSI